MLSEGIYHELRFLLYSVLLGIIITFVYDNIRVFRRAIRHNTFFISVEDLFFWIAVSLSIFLLQHRENDGVFRWFSVAGAFIGMLIYRKTVSRFYVKRMTIVLRKILYFLYLFFSYLFSPFYFVERKIGSLIKKFGRKSAQVAFRQKMRLTSYKKMIKMTLCKHTKKNRSERRVHEQKNRSSKKTTERI